MAHLICAAECAQGASTVTIRITTADPSRPTDAALLAVGVLLSSPYFLGMGGVVTLDVPRPDAPPLISRPNRRDYTSAEPGPDSGPEVIHFVPRGDSPSNTPMVLVANEVSGTVTFYEASR